ncbi:MAG TPA: SDR family oxidoreductase [Gemmatimonadaceae bacterium]|nr:SDR family oxidoreductase [Gemmatimonadaceae bacterium]
MKRRSVLITGATGAVGSELLRRFASRPGTAVNVLVRRGTERAAEIESILSEPTGTTVDDVYLPSERGAFTLATTAEADISIIAGDISAGPTLGMAPEAVASLTRCTTHIVHCGGTTSFTLPLSEARSLNVEGTRNVLEFARCCPSLQSAAFFSTVYVSGCRSGIFAESDEGDGGFGYVNTYEQSKAEMESVVRAAMESLPILLLRLSTVVGHSRTGAVRGFNAIHQAIRLLYNGLAPMIPGDPGEKVDIVSTDFVAEAALHLIDNHPGGGVFHLASGAEASTLDDLIGSTVDSLVRFRPAWRRRAIERPLLVDLDTYELFVRSVEETGNDVLRSATRSIRTFAYQLAHPKLFETRKTAEALTGSGIAPPPSLDFYPRVVKYCLESNWGMQQC